MKQKTIFFDFDGTIADTLDITLDSVNEVGRKLIKGFSKISAEEYKSKSAKELVLAYNLSPLKILRVILNSEKLIGARIDEVEIFPGMDQLLSDMMNEFEIVILTTNSKKNISFVFKKYSLECPKVLSTKSAFGKGKLFKKYLIKNKIMPSETLYIGDEIRDLEAASVAGVKTILVSWGYNSKKRLIDSSNDVVDDVKTLKKKIYEFAAFEGKNVS